MNKEELEELMAKHKQNAEILQGVPKIRGKQLEKGLKKDSVIPAPPSIKGMDMLCTTAVTQPVEPKRPKPR